MNNWLARILSYIDFAVLALLWFEYLDWTFKIISLAVGALLSWRLSEAAKARKRLDDINAQIKQQELWERIESNNARSMARKEKIELK